MGTGSDATLALNAIRRGDWRAAARAMQHALDEAPAAEDRRRLETARNAVIMLASGGDQHDVIDATTALEPLTTRDD